MISRRSFIIGAAAVAVVSPAAIAAKHADPVDRLEEAVAILKSISGLPAGADNLLAIETQRLEALENGCRAIQQH